MSRKRSSVEKAKKAISGQQSITTQNTSKIKQPKQHKINKRSTSSSTQLSGSLSSRADLSRAKSQSAKTSKKAQQRAQKQDIDIDKMSNKATNSKISKQHYQLKEKASVEVERMAKMLNRRLNKFQNEEGFDERRAKLDEEEYQKVEAEKKKYDSGQMSEEDLHDSMYYAGYQVYQQILAMIQAAESDKNPPFMVKHAESLYHVLQKEIRQFGFDNCMKSMGEAPEELVYYAQKSIESSNDEISRSYRYNLMSLIEGNIPTTQEAKNANDYEESTTEQTSEDYDRAEDTGWRIVSEDDVPDEW